MFLPAAANAGKTPYLVLVLADDFGYGDVRSLDLQYGKVPAPNIDPLAREGATFPLPALPFARRRSLVERAIVGWD